ncbi:MAG: DUF1801 domain-containing protein, partial [uncultured Adhaeribacter sp.]
EFGYDRVRSTAHNLPGCLSCKRPSAFAFHVYCLAKKLCGRLPSGAIRRPRTISV